MLTRRYSPSIDLKLLDSVALLVVAFRLCRQKWSKMWGVGWGHTEKKCPGPKASFNMADGPKTRQVNSLHHNYCVLDEIQTKLSGPVFLGSRSDRRTTYRYPLFRLWWSNLDYCDTIREVWHVGKQLPKNRSVVQFHVVSTVLGR